MVIFALAMLVAMARDLNGPGSHLRFDAWHHMYLGAGVFLLSSAVGRRYPVLGVVLRIIGLVLAWDDALQHAVQAVTGNLSFRSPLHVVYVWTYDEWQWMRSLTQWLDRLFGGP